MAAIQEDYTHESYPQDPWSMADQTEQAFMVWAQAQAWADAEAQAQAMAAQQAQAEAYAYAAAAQQFYAPPTPFAQPAYPQPFVPMAPPMAPAMPMMPMGMEQWASGNKFPDHGCKHWLDILRLEHTYTAAIQMQ